MEVREEAVPIAQLKTTIALKVPQGVLGKTLGVLAMGTVCPVCSQALSSASPCLSERVSFTHICLGFYDSRSRKGRTGGDVGQYNLFTTDITTVPAIQGLSKTSLPTTPCSPAKHAHVWERNSSFAEDISKHSHKLGIRSLTCQRLRREP